MKKSKIQEIDLSRIQMNEGQIEWLPRNPRQATKEDIEKTVKSIQEDEDFLEDRPVLLTPSDTALVSFGGNLRSIAARKAGKKTIPGVIYIPENEADRETIKRRAIKDNGTFGSWDFDALANEWDGPLTDWGVPVWEAEQTQDDAGAPEAQEDDFDEAADAVETRCKPGGIWQLGNHRLMCGDSTEPASVALLMNGEKADMVFTDPPYGMTALKWDTKIDLEKMFENIWSACKKDAQILVTGAQPFVTDLINAGRNFFRHEIIWKKTQSTGFLQVNHAPLKIHENILVFCKGDGTYNPQKKVIGEGSGRVRHQSANRAAHYHGNHESTYVEDGTRFPTSVIEFSNWNGALFGNVSNAVSHPTQKPVDLVAYLIETYSNNNDSVLDLFGGSGTTLIACEQLGRKCFMMELDPHYCDVILARWEKLTGQTATKL